MVQYLSLTLVMRASGQLPKHKSPDQSQSQLPESAGFDRHEKKLGALWTMARLLSSYDLHNEDRQSSIWAHSNLIELYLPAAIFPELPGSLPVADPLAAEELAIEHTDALIEIAGRWSFTVYSTRRQVLRYVEWFSVLAPAILPALAERIFNRFPGEAEEAWK